MRAPTTNAREKVFGSAEQVAQAAADFIEGSVASALSSRPVATLGLSGGSTPRRLFEILATRKGTIDWKRVRLFWIDERCVGPEDELSNFRMTRETLLSKVNLPEANVHRVRGEDDPAKEAQRYERLLFDVLGTTPRLDVALLGMGADGHTASIFPECAPFAEDPRWVAAVEAPQGVSPTRRITLTARSIHAARERLFLITGAAKTEVLKSIRSGLPEAELFPASWFREDSLWYLDEDAFGSERDDQRR